MLTACCAPTKTPHPGGDARGERAGLHPVPAVPFTAALGATRRVDAMSLVSFERGPWKAFR